MSNHFNTILAGLCLCFTTFSCSTGDAPAKATADSAQPVYKDLPFIQDFSIKYYPEQEGLIFKQVASDRNGRIQVLSSQGLLHTRAGQFLHPGNLVPDKRYRTSLEKQISGMTVYQDQFVYLDDEAVLSQAWAGKLFEEHSMPAANLVAGGEDFSFLISNGYSLAFLQNGKKLWDGEIKNGQVLSLKYDPKEKMFWILTTKGISVFYTDNQSITRIYSGEGSTAFEFDKTGSNIILGTRNGYILLDKKNFKPVGEVERRLPATHITCIRKINEELWFGSTLGAFKLREDGKFDYYFGERWLPGDRVVDLAPGPDRSVLILTDKGLGAIHFKSMTLYDKAVFYQQQIRDRHIRLGFNASLNGLENGDVSSGYLSDSDNDGLWTSMYLGGEVFRYAVTRSPDALQNCRESLEAMERLFSINPVAGFPSRSFERSGYVERLADPDRWQHSSDPEWDWKATTSSDEAIGHIFAYGVMAELIDNEELKQRAVHLIDLLMRHVVDNDLYLIDYDGKPTTWGRWNPEYVNARPAMVGDRKLNSSNIVAMLQTAYHFTQKEIYKEKAFELMDQHGYLENLMRPFSEIGPAPEDADDWSRMLSQSWNHSDDEMYFLGYWGLYRYAFNDSLKAMYKEAIIDHWEVERPEKEGAWNLFTAITGTGEFDLGEAIWYLKEYPLDLVTWTIKNSHRQDIEMLGPNFREQFTAEVLPPDELRISRHNANRFTLDGGNDGRSEYSAGDIWILPYWMGRYLGVISPPVEQ